MLIQGNAIAIPLPDKSVHCAVTSPPYWGLRKYAGDQGEEPLGLEATPERHVKRIVEICREVRRVLRDDGVFWLNYGDCYAGSKESGGLSHRVDGGKPHRIVGMPLQRYSIPQGSLMMMPHRVALALQADGWIVRQAITWIKGSPMPESVNGWRWQRGRTKTKAGDTATGRLERQQGKASWTVYNGPGLAGKNPESNRRKDLDNPEYEYGDDLELRRGSWRPSSATEMVFMLTKKMQYWGDAQSTRVLSKVLNRFDSISENGREMIGGLWSGISAESGNIPFNNHLAPYWILACLFGLQGILIEQGDDLFRKIIQAAQAPIGARIGVRICAAIARDASSEALTKFLENINVIISQPDLNEGPILMVSASHSVPDNKRAFAIKEACEMSPEIIANVEAIRNALTINASPEGIVNIDLIERAVPFRDCLIPLAGDLSNFVIPQPIIQEIDFLLGEFGFKEASSPSHSRDYTKTISGEGHNLWNWWFINTEAYPAAHYATFPRALVEPCVLATCPRWACPVCGQGWAAVVEHSHVAASEGWSGKWRQADPQASARRMSSNTRARRESGEPHDHPFPSPSVLGYKPTCEHPHTQEEAVPGIVFDPFVGSGTTVKVAQDLLRRGIGLDISKPYLEEQAKLRTGGIPKLKLDDLPLFKDTDDQAD